MNPSTGRLIVYWDYDTQWGADRSRASRRAGAWGPAEFIHTDRLLELHAAWGIQACFAVVGAAALPGERPYHDPAQVRAIFTAGHEIASHSFQHEWLPGLVGAPLRETLRRSRETLEDCIGAKVVSFVPPFNQPFDHWPVGSISLSERRMARGCRTDLRGLCEALRECGYQTCRVSYRPLHLRMMDWIAKRRVVNPLPPSIIAGITCLRLGTAGFGADASTLLERVAREGGLAITYGHPHSLGQPGAQGEEQVTAFLRLAHSLAGAGRIQVGLPRDIVCGGQALNRSSSL